VQLAIDAAREAHADWSRLPWEERASVYLRAAELLAGPWRSTLVAATMLNQSKTAHQAEIDAARRADRLLALQRRVHAPDLLGAAVSSPGVWNRMEYRPLEGFVFAVSPFNFTAIGGKSAARPR
jgi:1-pyrroline-5-carboxylate dehydrogenase